MNLFKQRNFSNLTNQEEKIAAIEANIKEYNEVNIYGTLFSATLVLHIVSTQVFNVFATYKIPYDRQTIIDIIVAVMNMVCFNLIGNMTSD